jgi:hypothetical protein
MWNILQKYFKINVIHVNTTVSFTKEYIKAQPVSNLSQSDCLLSGPCEEAGMDKL